MEFINSNKLKGYLSNESKRLGIHSNKIYTMYFIRSFLEKLYRSDEDNFIIKGSTSQLANTKTLTRPITDIDAANQMPLDEASNTLEKIINIDDDPIKYKMIDKYVTDKHTACIRILCSFDKIQHTIDFDLKEEESKHFINGILPPILMKDDPVLIKHIRIEQIIAEKMYVILKKSELCIKNNKKMRRFKDFYDLCNLINGNVFDINFVKEYFEGLVDKQGPIKISNFDLELLSGDFIADNQVAFNEDKVKYAFLKDMSFEELSASTMAIIEDTMSKIM